MLKVNYGEHTDTTVVVCDRCGDVCEESRQYAADTTEAIGWNGQLAMAEAKQSGWSEVLEGRLRRDICPQCQ